MPPEASPNRNFFYNALFFKKKDENFREESLAHCFVEFLEVFSLKKGYVFLGIE